MALWRWWPQSGMPFALNHCGGRGSGVKTTQVCFEIGLVGFQVCYASSTGCGRVCAQRRTSPINKCIGRSAALSSTEFVEVQVQRLSEDVVLKEFSGTPLSASSRDLEKGMKALRAAEECWSAEPQNFVALRQPIQDHSSRPDLQKCVDDRYVNRCIHHLLAVLPLPRTTAIDKESARYEVEEMVFSSRGVEMNLQADEDDEPKSKIPRSCGSTGAYCQKRMMHLWNGYWVGPDYEDGWGLLEALVSPVDMGEPVCTT